MSKKKKKDKMYMTYTSTKFDKSGKPVMKIVPSGIPGKSDTLYNSGTHQMKNLLTGEKSKKETLWMRKISAEEFAGKPKIKLKKKSGGSKKVVRK